MNPPLTHPFTLPADYTRIKVVHSFAELVTTPFRDGINALCWQRSLMGDFAEVAAALLTDDDITSIEPEQLKHLNLSPMGQIASEVLIQDLMLLREHGLEPKLDCIQAYARAAPSEIVATDVYSFHADSAPVAADTYLCAYTQAASEGLRNDQAQRRVDIPATRAALLQQFGADDGADFVDFLNENCYDLHYAPRQEAQPFSFGLGNLWRIAIEYPGSPVPPCIHRAPEDRPADKQANKQADKQKQPPRLLLIS